MSMTLLVQSAVGGLLLGGLYGLLGLGLSLSWGLLRLVNLSHFALAFLGAYLAYQLGTQLAVPPWASLLLIAPGFFVLGVALHGVFVRFRVTEFASMLVTFAITVLVESLIQWIWSADFRKFETLYANETLRLGPIFVPVLELGAFLCAAALALPRGSPCTRRCWAAPCARRRRMRRSPRRSASTPTGFRMRWPDCAQHPPASRASSSH
jgi:branched-chain amino acid transport system permease protein